MSKQRYAKNKGREGQKEVKALLLKIFNIWKSDDVKWTSSGANGEDIQLSPQARTLFPYSIEVKWNARIAACRFMEQAKENAGEHEPLVFMRENNGKWLVLCDAEHFIKAVSNQNHD